jgi:uncharacterized protein involved in exopolysaccharide biosynthesis
MSEHVTDCVSQDEELDLLDLMSVLLQRKKIIIGITTLIAVFVATYAFFSMVLSPETSYLPNEYTPKAEMLINDSSSAGGGLSSMLSSSGLGGLASLAGVSVPSASTYSSLAVYLAGTNSFLDELIDTFDLTTRYKIKKSIKTETRTALKKELSVSFDDESGVLSIAFTDIDPVFAQSVVNHAVKYMEERFYALGLDKNLQKKENLEKNIANAFEEIRRLEAQSQDLDRRSSQGIYSLNGSSIVLEAAKIRRELSAQEEIYKQLKIQYELLKVEMASETPVLQVLEYAEVPDRKSGPSRGMLCIIVTFAGFFASVFLAFVLNAIENIKKDPAAMAKLTGGSR